MKAESLLKGSIPNEELEEGEVQRTPRIMKEEKEFEDTEPSMLLHSTLFNPKEEVEEEPYIDEDLAPEDDVQNHEDEIEEQDPLALDAPEVQQETKVEEPKQHRKRGPKPKQQNVADKFKGQYDDVNLVEVLKGRNVCKLCYYPAPNKDHSQHQQRCQ